MILTPNPKNLLPRPVSGHSPDPAPYPDITLLTPSPIHSAFTCEVSSPSFLKFSFCIHTFFKFLFLGQIPNTLLRGSPDSTNFVLLGNLLLGNPTKQGLVLFHKKRQKTIIYQGICTIYYDFKSFYTYQGLY